MISSSIELVRKDRITCAHAHVERLSILQPHIVPCCATMNMTQPRARGSSINIVILAGHHDAIAKSLFRHLSSYIPRTFQYIDYYNVELLSKYFGNRPRCSKFCCECSNWQQRLRKTASSERPRASGRRARQRHSRRAV